MSRLQMTLVRVAGLESLRAVTALERSFACMPPEVLFVVRRVSELTATSSAGEAGRVVVNK